MLRFSTGAQKAVLIAQQEAKKLNHDYVGTEHFLLALLRHGIRIPEDVTVVSFANKGHLPIWDRALTRIEVDPAAHGAAVSQAVQKFLHGGQFPSGLSLGSVWIHGETF